MPFGLPLHLTAGFDKTLPHSTLPLRRPSLRQPITPQYCLPLRYPFPSQHSSGNKFPLARTEQYCRRPGCPNIAVLASEAGPKTNGGAHPPPLHASNKPNCFSKITVKESTSFLRFLIRNQSTKNTRIGDIKQSSKFHKLVLQLIYFRSFS